MSTIDKIQSLMALQRISAYQLERQIGLSNASIQAWRNNRSKPSAEALAKIATFFDVPVDYLMGIGLYQKEELIEQNWDLILLHLKNIRFKNFPDAFNTAISTILENIEFLPIYKRIDFLQLFLKDISYDKRTNQLTLKWNFT